MNSRNLTLVAAIPILAFGSTLFLSVATLRAQSGAAEGRAGSGSVRAVKPPTQVLSERTAGPVANPGAGRTEGGPAPSPAAGPAAADRTPDLLDPMQLWQKLNTAVGELGLPLRAIAVLVLLGLAAVLIVLWIILAFRHPRGGPDQLHEGDHLHLAVGAPRALGSPSAGGTPVGSPGAGRGAGASGAGDVRPSVESFRPRMHQERWSLPGFLALYSPLRELEPGPLSFSSREGLSIARDYRYETRPDDQGGFADLHALVLDLFARGARAEPQEQALFLCNTNGDVFCYGRMLGDVLLRDGFRPLPDGPLIDELREGGAVFSAEGSALYLPLFCVGGFIGYYVFLAGRPLFRRELVEELWFEVRRFSERALQGKLFDSAAREPESGLYSGALFHHDLALTCRLAPPHSRQLALLQFGGSLPGAWAGIGTLLTAEFPGHTAYRIGLLHAALLGPSSTEAWFGEAIAAFLAILRTEARVDVSAGVAVLDEDVRAADAWFSRARVALIEAAEAGPNHFRLWAPRVPVGAGLRSP